MTEMKLAPLTFSQDEGSDTCTVWAADGDQLATLYGSLGLDENAEDRARLIVQAVNSHDALVDALEVAGDELEHIIRAFNLNPDPDVLEKIDAALALAKQEAQ